ncbi:MAG: HAD family hydrolase [Candidatus Woesearchaeota archaeon]
MSVKVVMFDFWGTLCETGTFSPIQQTRNILRVRVPYSEFVKKLEKSFMQQHYNDWNEAFQNVCKEFNVKPDKFIIERLTGIWNKAWLFAKFYPETEKVLKDLKAAGYKLVLISNCDNLTKEKILEKFALDEYFDAACFSCDMGVNKTECYDNILKKLGATKEEVIMVGDSMESDIKGAERAGIKAILVDRRDRREFSPKVNSLEQLKQFL